VEVVELGDSGCERLFTMLADTPNSLETVYLNGNGVSTKTCRAIASFLKNAVCKLTGLFMASNPVGDSGAEELPAGLSNNATLLRLSLASCGLSSVGEAFSLQCTGAASHRHLR